MQLLQEQNVGPAERLDLNSLHSPLLCPPAESAEFTECRHDTDQLRRASCCKPCDGLLPDVSDA